MSLISIVPGDSGTVSRSPKNLIIGISSRYDSTPPPAMVKAMRGPMM